MWKMILIVFLIGLVLILDVGVVQSSAQASSAYEVVAAVNDLRAANGLPPLEADPILMSIAQAHSDYQASIGMVTHTGPGGSSPKDRAYAAGFGGGATVFLSENIAGGINLSIQTAINKYWQDDLHLATMLNPAAVYIGAGVGRAGEYVYYTVDAGYYSGAPSPGYTSVPGDNTTPGPTAIPFDPFVVSTPKENGAIVHVVGYGQTLVGIAHRYKVALNDIMQLNKLNMESIIYPGEKIIIQASSTPTLTLPPTKTPPRTTPTAKATALKITPTPRSTFSPGPTASPSATLTPPNLVSTGRERLVVGVVVMSLAVFLIVVFSGFRSGKSGRDQ